MTATISQKRSQSLASSAVPYVHEAVLRREVRAHLQISPGALCIDATVGGGSHAADMLEDSAPDGRLLGLDLDPRAIQEAGRRLTKYGSRAMLVRASYADLPQIVAMHPEFTQVDAILADLGFSSDQVDSQNRGFSFNDTSVFDMRFDPEGGETGSEYLLRATPEELSTAIRSYGEISHPEKIVQALIEMRDRARAHHRQILTTDVVSAIERVWQRRGQTHPATVIFQALRIAVNREWENIERFIPEAIKILRPGGRLGILTFHSLEDRIVKRMFRVAAGLKASAHDTEEFVHEARVALVTKTPLQPGRDETRSNPRSRSAKLRVVQKL